MNQGVFSLFFLFFYPHPPVLGSRSIAKVVSQVHAFQEASFPYSPDQELQAYLRGRIARLAASDVHLLATNSDSTFQPSSERQTRRIQEKLRRVKATFQWAVPRSQLTLRSEAPWAGHRPHVSKPRLRIPVKDTDAPVAAAAEPCGLERRRLRLSGKLYL